MVDVTGVAAVIPQALELVCEVPWVDGPLPETRYVVQGSYAKDFSIPYDPAFFKRLSFLLPRNYQQEDLLGFFAALSAGRLQAEDLVCRVVAPEAAPEAYESFRDPGKVPGTIAFRWRD